MKRKSESDSKGSPCDAVWDWIESKKFRTEKQATKYWRKTNGNSHSKDCIENYPWNDSEKRIIQLRKEGKSRNVISQILRDESLSPRSHNYVQQVLKANSLSGRIGRILGLWGLEDVFKDTRNCEKRIPKDLER